MDCQWKKSSCPLANISVCIWDSDSGTHSSTAVIQPGTADRFTAVGSKAGIPHLPVAKFLNSIINYFSIFTVYTTKYGLHLLPRSNHKPNLSEQYCSCNVYGIYRLYNCSVYVNMVMTYKSISTDQQDFVTEMLYKENN